MIRFSGEGNKNVFRRDVALKVARHDGDKMKDTHRVKGSFGCFFIILVILCSFQSTNFLNNVLTSPDHSQTLN